jgi:hypothetical protein
LRDFGRTPSLTWPILLPFPAREVAVQNRGEQGELWRLKLTWCLPERW